MWGRGCVTSRPDRFTPVEEECGTHRREGCVGPSACVGAGWVPVPVWWLGGSQCLSGGWVGPSTCLVAGWVPVPVWRLGESQCLCEGWVSPSASLEAGWVPVPLWRLGGSQSLPGHCGEEKILFLLLRIEPQVFRRPARSLFNLYLFAC
jgi:hypothetical protein